MRFSLAVLGLAAAVSATAVDAKAGADVDAQVAAGAAAGAKVGTDVHAKVGTDVNAKVGADVNAQVGAGAGVDAKVDADAKVGAEVAVGAKTGAKVGADVNAHVGTGAGAKADVDAKVAAGTAAGAKVGADVNAQVGAGGGGKAGVDAKVGADVAVGAKAGAGVDVNAKVNADVAAGANVDAQVATDVAVGAKAGAGAAAGVDVNTKVDTGAAAGVKVDAGVGAKLSAGKTIDAQVSADVDAQVATISAKYGGGAAVDAGIHGGAGLDLSGGGRILNVTTGAGLRVDAAVKAAIDAAVKGFSCPATMTYCPWTKACSCAPGLSYSAATGSCTGGARLPLHAWPAPALDLFASVHVPLAAFCAASPVKMCRYDAAHEFCQASLDTITFVAEAKIGNELDKLGSSSSSAAIDVAGGNVSAELKAVSAGLHGLYLERVEDAVALFNSKAYGLQVLDDDDANIEAGFITRTQLVLCKLGLGSCQRDCVSFSGKGCANHIDIGAQVGAQITGLVNGVCILPSVILVANQAKVLVSVAVEHLLCVVGNVIKTFVATFDCHCK